MNSPQGYCVAVVVVDVQVSIDGVGDGLAQCKPVHRRGPGFNILQNDRLALGVVLRVAVANSAAHVRDRDIERFGGVLDARLGSFLRRKGAQLVQQGGAFRLPTCISYGRPGGGVLSHFVTSLASSRWPPISAITLRVTSSI